MRRSALVAAVLLVLAASAPVPSGGLVSNSLKLESVRTVVRQQDRLSSVTVAAAVWRLRFRHALELRSFNGSLSVSQLPVKTWLRADTAGEPAAQLAADGRGLLSLRCADAFELASLPVQGGASDSTGALLPLHWHLTALPAVDGAPFGPAAAVSLLNNLHAVSRNDSLVAALLLRYEEDNGLLVDSPLLSSVGDIDAVMAMLARCQLRLLAPWQQPLWPVKSLHAAGDEAALVLPAALRWLPPGDGGCAAGSSAAVLLSSAVLREEQGRGATDGGVESMLTHYPELSARWYSVVPPPPRYCEVLSGALPQKRVRRLLEARQMAFLETGFPVPQLDSILKMFAKLVMPPVFDPFVDLISTHVTETVDTRTGHDVNAATPKDVVKMLSPALTRNLTALLTDSITSKLSRTVTQALLMDLGPRIAEGTHKAVVPGLHEHVAELLDRALPENLDEVLPALLRRSLPIHLTKELSQTVTHSVVPALTLSLSFTPEQQYFCYWCYYRHEYCNYCHESPQSLYYTNYYSTYYSDWYADYYTKYYVDALVELDKKIHDWDDQEKAAAANLRPAEAELL